MRRPPKPATTTAPPTATPAPSAVWEMASVAANAAGVAARDAAAKAPAGSAGEGLAAFSAATERLAAALGATTARATQEVRVDILRDDRSGMSGSVCRIPRGAVGRRGRGWQSDYIYPIGRSFFPPHGPVPRVSATGCEGSNRARNATSGTIETVARLVGSGRDAHLSIVTRVRSIRSGSREDRRLPLLRGGSTKIIQSELENEIGCDGRDLPLRLSWDRFFFLK